MKLFRGVQAFKEFDKGVVVTIGNFDGVHLGHQHLIQLLKNRSNSLNLPSVLILFEPQANEYFQGNRALPRLSNLREKLALLKQQQVDYVCCIKFNNQLAHTSASDFVKESLFSKLKINYLLVGSDFRFGKNREGDVALLQTLGRQQQCEVEVYQDFCIEGERVSSTRIRKALQEKNLPLASKYLGRFYSLCGRVVRGDGRGRQWGIPTANLNLQNRTLPLRGVFAVKVRRGDQLIDGVANLGTRPSVDGTKNSLEVHLFDFDASIYGEFLQVFFLHQLRDEVKFTSVDSLISQIQQDIAAAKAFLSILVANEFSVF